MIRRLAHLAALLLGCALGLMLPAVAQRISLEAVVLLAVLAALTHLCGRCSHLLERVLQFPRAAAAAPPGIRPSLPEPTATRRRRLAWLARARPPHTGPPRPGRHPDHPDGLPQDPAAPP